MRRTVAVVLVLGALPPQAGAAPIDPRNCTTLGTARDSGRVATAVIGREGRKCREGLYLKRRGARMPRRVYATNWVFAAPLTISSQNVTVELDRSGILMSVDQVSEGASTIYDVNNQLLYRPFRGGRVRELARTALFEGVKGVLLRAPRLRSGYVFAVADCRPYRGRPRRETVRIPLDGGAKRAETRVGGRWKPREAEFPCSLAPDS